MRIVSTATLFVAPAVGQHVTIVTKHGGVTNHGRVVSVDSTTSPAGRPMWRIRTTLDTSYVPA